LFGFIHGAFLIYQKVHDNFVAAVHRQLLGFFIGVDGAIVTNYLSSCVDSRLVSL
jgi:hypothetical protein